jgi:formiminoglutamase
MLRYQVIGVPDDRGVENSGGRRGAADGPASFRTAFQSLSGRDGLHASLGSQRAVDRLGDDIRKNHSRVTEVVRSICSQGEMAVLIGGGHDYAFAQLAGIKAAVGARKRIGCINVDAHLDVRRPSPFITSGSAFFLALDRGVIEPQDLIEFATQRQLNSAEAWAYAEEQDIKVIPLSELRHGSASRVFAANLVDLADRCDAIVLSLDLDAIASAFAPGVSSPATDGLSVTDVVEIMEIAGMETMMISLGIFELNPLVDVDQRTARLAATAAYYFLDSAIRSRKTVTLEV